MTPDVAIAVPFAMYALFATVMAGLWAAAVLKNPRKNLYLIARRPRLLCLDICLTLLCSLHICSWEISMALGYRQPCEVTFVMQVVFFAGSSIVIHFRTVQLILLSSLATFYTKEALRAVQDTLAMIVAIIFAIGFAFAFLPRLAHRHFCFHICKEEGPCPPGSEWQLLIPLQALFFLSVVPLIRRLKKTPIEERVGMVRGIRIGMPIAAVLGTVFTILVILADLGLLDERAWSPLRSTILLSILAITFIMGHVRPSILYGYDPSHLFISSTKTSLESRILNLPVRERNVMSVMSHLSKSQKDDADIIAAVEEVLDTEPLRDLLLTYTRLLLCEHWVRFALALRVYEKGQDDLHAKVITDQELHRLFKLHLDQSSPYCVPVHPNVRKMIYAYLHPKKHRRVSSITPLDAVPEEPPTISPLAAEEEVTTEGAKGADDVRSPATTLAQLAYVSVIVLLSEKVIPRFLSSREYLDLKVQLGRPPEAMVESEPRIAIF